MLNFKKFLQNVGAFSNDGGQYDQIMKTLVLPDDTLELPSTTTAKPVNIFRIIKKGKTYQILGDGNMTWNMPSYHYEHLLQQGKAPKVGDSVYLTFNGDGSVKSFSFANSR